MGFRRCRLLACLTSFGPDAFLVKPNANSAGLGGNGLNPTFTVFTSLTNSMLVFPSKQKKKSLLLRHVIHTHTAGYGGFAVASHSDLHYQDEMLCIDEFEKMESAEIWKGE